MVIRTYPIMYGGNSKIFCNFYKGAVPIGEMMVLRQVFHAFVVVTLMALR